jgi:hypothetical protein
MRGIFGLTAKGGLARFEASAARALEDFALGGTRALVVDRSAQALFARIGLVPEGAALASWDAREGRLTLEAPLWSLEPLYILELEDAMAFCSEAEPLLRLSGERLIDEKAVAEFFAVGAPLGGRTFLRGIRRLAPGERLEWNDGRLERLPRGAGPEPALFGSAAESGEAVYEAFRSATVRLSREPGLEACTLTGGLDTRFILGCLPRNLRRGLLFRTFRNPELPPDRDKDVLCARRLAADLGLRHEETERPLVGEFGPETFDRTRPGDDRPLLWGLMGGQLLGGWARVVSPYLDPERDGTAWARERARGCFGDAFLRRCGAFQEPEEAGLPAVLDLFMRPFLCAIFGGSFGRWLRPGSFFLEGFRMPFLDPGFLAVLRRVPDRLLRGHRLYLGIMEHRHPDLLRLPLASGGLGTRDRRIVPMREGEFYNGRVRHRYGESLSAALRAPSVWGRENYRKSFLARLAFVGRYRLWRDPGNIRDPLLARFAVFETWLRTYCPWAV